MEGKWEVLKSLFYDIKSQGGLGGERKLLKAAKLINPQITIKDVKEFLSQQDAHTLHKITKKNFARRKILAPKPKVIVSCDLTDMTRLAKYNNEYKYIVVFIDVFSRFTKAVPLKRKNAETLRQVIQSTLESEEFKGTSRLFVDRGGEFYNKKVLEYCQENNIKLYSVSSYEIKASIAERVIQTLKRKIYKYLTANNTMKYVNVLSQLVENYNHAFHRSLGTSPVEVHKMKDPKKIREQFYRMYKKGVVTKASVSSDLSVGDGVRINSKYRSEIFRRGYVIQNTEEIFKIAEIDQSQNPNIYTLKDLAGENISGIFYRPELVPTTVPENFPIRILKKRNKKYFVHWIGYPDTFDSWINESDLRSVQTPINL